jgi:beta-lactamase class A
MHLQRLATVSAGLVVTASLFATGPTQALTSASPSASPAASRVVTLTCEGIGDFRLVLKADALPAPQTPLPSGVSLRTAYQATDSRTAAPVSGGERGDVSCGRVPVNAVLFRALSNGPAPAGVLETDLFDGSVSVGLVIAEPRQPASQQRLLTAAAVPGEGTPFPFAGPLKAYLAARSGRESVSVFNAKTGQTQSFNAGAKHVTASIVKVAILGTLLRQAQNAHRSLTATERSRASAMIKFSDNAASTLLWNQVGKGPGVKVFMDKVGMPSTTPGPGGFWGLTSTNTPDQVRLVRTVAYPNAVLTAASRSYADSLMRGVTPSQKWGVSGGVPASATVALKNGWLPRTGGWVINSIGHVRGGTRDYVIAVLTTDGPGMSYGINTVEHVSAMVWSASQSLSRTPFGDFNGDGWSDVLARQTSTGSLNLYLGNGAKLRSNKRFGNGWNRMNAITRMGDFNKDGHEDVIAREAATGALLLYRGTGSGFKPRLTLSSRGWNDMREITPVGDLDGDGFPDLLAVRTSTGFLYLYPGRGSSLGAKRLIGGGWNAMSELTGVGDFNRDGHVDLMARRTATGTLRLYKGTGTTLGVQVQVGAGWQRMRDIVGVGDFERGGFNDLLAVESSTGKLFRYPGRGTSFGPRVLLGSGWTGGLRPLL